MVHFFHTPSTIPQAKIRTLREDPSTPGRTISMHHVFICSVGTGRTATRFLDAAMTQHEYVNLERHLRADLRTRQEAEQAVIDARSVGGS